MFAAVFGLVALMSAPEHSAAQSIPIAVSSGFASLFSTKIIPLFSKRTGIHLTPTFASTALLARQIEDGAPYQVLVAGDPAAMHQLTVENMIPLDTVHVLCAGRLALWSLCVPVDRLGLASLRLPRVAAIAVSSPGTATYGAAAIQMLTNAGLLSALQPKLVYAENINESLQMVKLGTAQIAFVSDALVKSLPGHVYIIAPGLYPALDQSIGLTIYANAAAREFEKFLLSKLVRGIFVANGYMPPPRGS